MNKKLIDLLEFVESRKDVPFEWGKQDCCLFAADAVVAMGGEDYAAPYRGKYSTEIGAKRLLSKSAKDGLNGLISDILEPIDKNMAQRGDVVLFDGGNGDTLGIYWMGGIFCAGEQGAVLIDAAHDKIHMVWRFKECQSPSSGQLSQSGQAPPHQ